ncbi:hypothetical protein KAS50_05140, partial [bacterium]|nr:hypothetical protein [bacterium]
VTFLTGGVLGVFNEPERKFSFGTFFGDSGKYFIRFFIFTAGAVACYIVIVKYFAPWFSGIFESITENAKEEKVPFFVERLKNIVFLIMLFFVGMVFDYSRILTVVDQRRNVIISFFKSLYIIFRHIHRTFTIYYVLAFAGFVLIALYWAAGNFIPQDTFLNIAILFGLQQLYILLKLYLRCTFFTSQMVFYKGASGKAEEVKKEIVPEKEEPSDIKEEYKEENNEPQEN